MKKYIVGLSILLVILLFSGEFIFVVNQIEQSVITRLGEPVRVIKEPGLYAKIPLFESVTTFDKRMMSIELSALEVTLGDKRRVVVDAFGRYVINDPLRFYQTVYSEFGVIQRLTPVVLGGVSSVLGNLSLPTLLSSQRSEVMKKIKDEVNKSAIRFGITMVDVRITKTDFPSQNNEAIARRMISERHREASELRAKGAEKAREIRSTADKENAIAVAEAERKSQILIGEGEAEANTMYAKTYSQDKVFFNLYKTLETCRDSLKPDNTSFILTKDENIFKQLYENNK